MASSAERIPSLSPSPQPHLQLSLSLLLTLSLCLSLFLLWHSQAQAVGRCANWCAISWPRLDARTTDVGAWAYRAQSWGVIKLHVVNVPSSLHTRTHTLTLEHTLAPANASICGATIWFMCSAGQQQRQLAGTGHSRGVCATIECTIDAVVSMGLG